MYTKCISIKTQTKLAAQSSPPPAGTLDQPTCDFESSVTAFPPLSLGTLHLIGFDFSKIIGPSISILELQSLSMLTLETCPGLERAFDILAREKNQSDVPLRSRLQLRSFSLRHEGSNPAFKIRLLGFLCAIRGLTHLSILLEDSTRSHPHDLNLMLAVHGQSLRSLVWDERSGRRDLFVPSEGTHAPGHLWLRTIAQGCPKLVELGISMDWRDFTQKASSEPHLVNRNHTRRAFALFKHLRTLNVRNMPLVDPKNMALPLSEIHAGFANSLVKILLCKKDALSPSAPQNLKTLALGALTYRDTRNGIGYHTIHKRELYEFLRLKVFRVVRNYQVDDGRPKPAAVLTESGTYEKTEANGGDVNILKPYWLG
ncbi:MAG: hypothetical protein Q9180_004727 [Flavoplaca navasiana]